LDAAIDRRHLLTHPFYRSWMDGTLPLDALQEYTRQYYAFESSFPRVLSALHSRSDRADVRQALLENLWDEEHGESNHQEQWLRFAEGIGVDRQGVWMPRGTRPPAPWCRRTWTSPARPLWPPACRPRTPTNGRYRRYTI